MSRDPLYANDVAAAFGAAPRKSLAGKHWPSGHGVRLDEVVDLVA
ncbi:hypothetical protein ABTZ99_28970 [Actinosynnema sp. NPDC002837]